MRAEFTSGSCFAWRGAIPRLGAPVRVLDLTLEGGRTELITVVLEPVRNGGEGELFAAQTEAEVEIEWGTEQGSAHKAVIDIGRGVTLGLAASRLVAAVRNIGTLKQLEPPELQFRASAALGRSGVGFQPVRQIRLAGALPKETIQGWLVPAFARRVTLLRVPQNEAQISFLSGNGRPISTSFVARDRDEIAIVPAGAHRFEVKNLGKSPVLNMNAVFELAL